MDRLVEAGNSGLGGRHRGRRGRRHRPAVAVFNAGSAERQPPGPRVVLQRPDLHHARRLRDRNHARRPPERHRRLEARPLRRRHRLHVRAQRGLVGWPDAARRPAEFTFFDDLGTMLTGDAGRCRRRARPVLGHRRRRPAQRPDFHVARRSRRPPTARSGCAATPASSPTSGSARRSRSRSTAIRCSRRCSRGGRASATTTSSRRSSRTSTTPCRSATSDIEQAKAAAHRRRRPEGLQAVLQIRNLQEIPRAGPAHPGRAAEARHHSSRSPQESTDTFYGTQWCPAEPADPPCSGAAELGIVDYGDRPTPDIYLNAALKTERRLELVAVLEPRRSTPRSPSSRLGRRSRPEGGLQEDRDDPQRRRPGRSAVLLQLPVRALEDVPGRPGDGARADVPGEGVARPDRPHDAVRDRVACVTAGQRPR